MRDLVIYVFPCSCVEIELNLLRSQKDQSLLFDSGCVVVVAKPNFEQTHRLPQALHMNKASQKVDNGLGRLNLKLPSFCNFPQWRTLYEIVM